MSDKKLECYEHENGLLIYDPNNSEPGDACLVIPREHAERWMWEMIEWVRSIGMNDPHRDGEPLELPGRIVGLSDANEEPVPLMTVRMRREVGGA